jgi:hypothetical protein
MINIVYYTLILKSNFVTPKKPTRAMGKALLGSVTLTVTVVPV